MLEWLIIGGGIHGTYCSHLLVSRGGVSRSRVRVLDPHPEPLACWHHRARNTGMQFLRSPDVHNLDLEPMSLFHFTRERHEPWSTQFTGIYRNQPALDLFHTHSQWIIDQHRLAELRLTGTATGLSCTATGVSVETSAGTLRTRHVLLAVGPADPCWPAWATQLRTAGAPIGHVFDPAFCRTDVPAWSHAVVIGGGITAVQTALALAQQAPGTVTLLTRHEFREHPFDSDPCWFSMCLAAYQRETDYQHRRATIRKARYRGSVPPDILRQLHEAVTAGILTVKIGDVTSATLTVEMDVSLSLEALQETINCDRIVLATGFAQERPGGAWLTQAIADYALPCSHCGYPIVDQTLQWRHGVYVTGALAELEIGPVARNIIGARLAGERLLSAV